MENIKTYDLNDAVINNKRTTYYNYRPNHCNRLTFAHLPYYAPWKIIIQASVFMHKYEWMNETSNIYSIDYLFINLIAYFFCNHPDQQELFVKFNYKDLKMILNIIHISTAKNHIYVLLISNIRDVICGKLQLLYSYIFLHYLVIQMK